MKCLFYYFCQVTEDSYESCTGFAKTSPEAGPATWMAPAVVSIFHPFFFFSSLSTCTLMLMNQTDCSLSLSCLLKINFSKPPTFTLIDLLQLGNNYFACGVPGHCSGGMKAMVEVKAVCPTSKVYHGK